MSNEKKGIKDWIGYVAATIVSGVAIWYLTEGQKVPATEAQTKADSTQEEIASSAQEGIENPSLLSRERWKYVGTSTKTGEDISIDSDSVEKSDSSTRFNYKIGSDLLEAVADCNENKWYARNRTTQEEYGWFNPESPATQTMMNYVCD